MHNQRPRHRKPAPPSPPPARVWPRDARAAGRPHYTTTSQRERAQALLFTHGLAALLGGCMAAWVVLLVVKAGGCA